MIFALAMVPIIVMAGSAMDYHRATSADARVQAALDAATLAGAKAPTPSERAQVAGDVFRANTAALKLNAIGVTFQDEADGSFSGVATGKVATTLMNVVGIDAMHLTNRSRVAVTLGRSQTPTSLTLTAEGATGWFYKEITLFVHYPGNASDTELARWVYQPTDLRNNGVGTVTGPIGTPIPLGTNYDKVYLTMLVSEDGCSPSHTPLHPEAIQNYDTAYWPNYTCVPVNPPFVTKSVAPFLMSTNDGATSNHLFVNDHQLPLGQSLNIGDIAKCAATVHHSWEDTRVYTPPTSSSDAWAKQDFLYDVIGGSCAENTEILTSERLPRLTR